jgi:hypothetical protein
VVGADDLVCGQLHHLHRGRVGLGDPGRLEQGRMTAQPGHDHVAEILLKQASEGGRELTSTVALAAADAAASGVPSRCSVPRQPGESPAAVAGSASANRTAFAVTLIAAPPEQQ